MSYFWDDVFAIGGIVLGVLALLVAVVAIVNFTLVKPSCERTADAMGLEADYGFYTGCLVTYDGQVVDIDELRQVR